MNEMSLSKTYTKVFRIFGKNFGKLVVGVIPMLVGNILNVVLQNTFAANLQGVDAGYLNPAQTTFWLGQTPWALLGLSLGIWILALLCQTFSLGYIMYFAAKAADGEAPSIKQAYIGSLKRFGPMLLTILAMYALIVVFVGLCGGGIAFTVYKGMIQSNYLMAIVLVMIMFVIILAAAYFLYHFLFAYPATIVEKRSGFGAVFHGLRIFFKGGYGRNLGHLWLMILGFMAVTMAMIIPISIGAIGSMMTGGDAAITSYLTSAIMMIVGAALSIIIYIFLTVEYQNSLKYIQMKKEQQEQELLQGEEK